MYLCWQSEDVIIRITNVVFAWGDLAVLLDR